MDRAQVIPFPQEATHFAVEHIPWKRLFDIVFSLTVLLVGTPIFLLIAGCVAITSRGGVVYGHKRVGRGGKTFRCYKFRTMHHNAAERLKELLDSDPEVKKEWETTFKLKNDPRITKFGAFLRKTSLDELPQFFNVLKGDLSVVGPRPVMHEELNAHFGAKATKILSIRPGITGLWQVSGRSQTSYEDRVKLDEEYVERKSPWLDLLLICKTIPAIFSAKGAY